VFMDRILIPTEIIRSVPDTSYEINHVQFRNILIYGQIGSGKTECVRKLAEILCDYYGEANVNCKQSTDLELTMQYGLDDKLVQLLFIDDLTLQKVPSDVLSRYFTIRHDWLKCTGRNYGYILSVLGVHRFFSIDPLLRSNLDGIIFRSSGTNPYDRSFIRKIIGDVGLSTMDQLEQLRTADPTYYKYSVYWLKGDVVGLLELDLADQNYLSPVMVPISELYNRLL